MKAKLTNILVADIKNLAARRGEKAVEWAQRAVAEAAAATAEEALDLGVIDVVATDVSDLLDKVDGRKVTVAGTEVTLNTADAVVEEFPLSALESLLNQVTNPTIAAILLTIGLNAILFELSSPGGYAAGIVGVACLLLAFYGLGTLNANWAGLAFVGLALSRSRYDRIVAFTNGFLSSHGELLELLVHEIKPLAGIADEADAAEDVLHHRLLLALPGDAPGLSVAEVLEPPCHAQKKTLSEDAKLDGAVEPQV